MNNVNASNSTSTEISQFVYSRACDLGSGAAKLPAQAISSVRKLLMDNTHCVREGALAAKDYIAYQADFLAGGISKLDPQVLGINTAVVASSIFASSALAFSAIKDAKQGDRTKAALKASTSLALTGAGAYAGYDLGSKAFAAALAHQEALNTAQNVPAVPSAAYYAIQVLAFILLVRSGAQNLN